MVFNHTVLGQLLKSVPGLEFEQLAQQYDVRRRSNTLPRWGRFVSLLARANEKPDADFHQQLFHKLYQRRQQSGAIPGNKLRFKGKLFALDGSLIDLLMKVFPWADIAPKKAASKLQPGLDHDGMIPAFAAVSEGLGSEMGAVDTFNFPLGSVLVFDRGYCSYDWHKALSDKGLYWVTRSKPVLNPFGGLRILMPPRQHGPWPTFISHAGRLSSYCISAKLTRPALKQHFH